MDAATSCMKKERDYMRIIVLLAILAAIIILQIYLSKRENKWCGLILPIIGFLFALLLVPQNTMASATWINMNYIVNLMCAFAVYNIPTVVFMVIYIVCRKGRRWK